VAWGAWTVDCGLWTVLPDWVSLWLSVQDLRSSCRSLSIAHGWIKPGVQAATATEAVVVPETYRCPGWFDLVRRPHLWWPP